MAAKVAIIGKGRVGSALQRGMQRVGCEVRITGKEPGAAREAAGWGELVFLAVPFGAIDETLKELGDAVKGKVLVDVTNALTADMKLALGCTTSGAEELQKKAVGAKVVKAFNTVLAGNMDKGKVKGETLTLFVAGDDAGAKERVLKLGRDIGFDALDAGPLTHARWLETLGFLNIQLALTQKLGTETGFRYVR